MAINFSLLEWRYKKVYFTLWTNGQKRCKPIWTQDTWGLVPPVSGAVEERQGGGNQGAIATPPEKNSSGMQNIRLKIPILEELRGKIEILSML